MINRLNIYYHCQMGYLNMYQIMNTIWRSNTFVNAEEGLIDYHTKSHRKKETIMMSWNGNAFRINCPLWPVTSNSLNQIPWRRSSFYVDCLSLNKLDIIEQILELSKGKSHNTTWKCLRVNITGHRNWQNKPFVWNLSETAILQT